jgi:hypothetical protein
MSFTITFSFISNLGSYYSSRSRSYILKVYLDINDNNKVIKTIKVLFYFLNDFFNDPTKYN